MNRYFTILNLPFLRRSLYSLILSLAIVCQGLSSHAVDLLDNTANGTATFSSSTGSSLNALTIKQGLQFDIASGYSATLSTIRLALQNSTVGMDIQLWSWNGTAGSLLGTQNVVGPSNTRAYYTFNLTDPVFTNLSAGSYLVTGSSSSSLMWANSDPLTDPTSPTTGFSFVQYRRSTNGGSSWVGTSNKNSIQLSGSVAAVPEPSTYLLCSLATGIVALVSKKRNLKKA